MALGKPWRFSDITVSAVAERAGVGIGSLYRRYGSKDDLLRHLCLLAMRQAAAAAADARTVADAWEGLTDALRADVTPLDIAHLVEMFGSLGPVRPESEEHVIRQRLLAIALDGLRSGVVTASLPAPAPTTEHYERRWARRC